VRRALYEQNRTKKKRGKKGGVLSPNILGWDGRNTFSDQERAFWHRNRKEPPGGYQSGERKVGRQKGKGNKFGENIESKGNPWGDPDKLMFKTLAGGNPKISKCWGNKKF